MRLPARGGDLIVRHGRKGGFREVPLHPSLRAVLEEWLGERAGWKGADSSWALFLNRRGSRLSSRSAHAVLRAVVAAAGLPLGRDGGGDGAFTPRVLRHTAGQAMARQGTDTVVVADLLGLSVETARRHRPLTEEDRRRAIQRLTVEE
ncbi:tyrosine-type recombinase/integrase [Actinomadura sp. KC216]|uniref:tyrosine-type recombinase/integrase n=1 Tax=Actinomadura sp. KC216 TaxID=2530370 RepID=UPI0014047826|nr:tyrosine-type recombinase/integrase [Actinomadura sp. KC216]